jgi:hypothetical protein
MSTGSFPGVNRPEGGLTTHPHLPPSGGNIFWTHPNRPRGPPSLLLQYWVHFLGIKWPRLKYCYTSTSYLLLTCYGTASVYVCVFSTQQSWTRPWFRNQKSNHLILLPVIDVLQSKIYYAKGTGVKNLCFAVMWTLCLSQDLLHVFSTKLVRI